jgi:hypothetical protein
MSDIQYVDKPKDSDSQFLIVFKKLVNLIKLYILYLAISFTIGLIFSFITILPILYNGPHKWLFGI